MLSEYESQDLMELMTKADNGDFEAMRSFVTESLIDVTVTDNTGIIEKRNEYVRKLAANGDGNALIYLGEFYRRGELGEPDINRAIEYYEMAAEAGVRFGYECLAEIYMDGRMVSKDYQKVYEYLKKSMKMSVTNEDHEHGKLDSDLGCYILGELYFWGLYVEKNLELALVCYEQVISMGEEMIEAGYGDSSFYWRAALRKAEIMETKGDTEESARCKKIVEKHYYEDEAKLPDTYQDGRLSCYGDV